MPAGSEDQIRSGAGGKHQGQGNDGFAFGGHLLLDATFKVCTIESSRCFK